MRKIFKGGEYRFLYLALVAGECLLLVYYNIFHLKDVIDGDFAMNLKHVVEMSKQQHFFLKGWNYTTTAELDCPSVLATVINVFSDHYIFSYAVANILSLALCIFVVYRLTEYMKMTLIYRLLVIGFMLVPYNFGMLEFANMTFFGQGSYIYKSMCPLYLILVLATPKRDWSKPIDILTVVIYECLLFLTGVSSGIYILICGITPVIICVLSFFLQCYYKIREGGRLRYIILGVMTVVTELVALIINKVKGVNSGTKLLTSPEGLGGVIAAISDYVLLFFQPDKQSVFSVFGIIQLLNLCILLIITVFGFKSIAQAFGYGHYCNLVQKHIMPEDKDSVSFIEAGLISVFLVNFAVLILTDSSPRYHLIGVFPLIICAGYNLYRFSEQDKTTCIPHVLGPVIITLITILDLLLLYYAQTDYFRCLDGENVFMEQVVDLAHEYEAETVFFAGPTDFAQKLRLFDSSRNYEAIYCENQSVSIRNVDYYDYACDREAFSDKNMLLFQKGVRDISDYPQYVTDMYEKVSEIDTGGYIYEVWYSEDNPFDGKVGFPDSTESAIDLPTSEGFIVNGEIGKDGHLYSTDNIVLSSPGFYSDGKEAYMLTLEYDQTGSPDTFFDVYYNMERVVSIPLQSNEHKISVMIPELEGEYIYSVRNDANKPGDQVIIKKIQYRVE